MEIDRNIFFVLMAAAGLMTGVLASDMTESKDSSECEELEEEIKSSQSFEGSLACYPPGVIDTNISEGIENRTELKCVCRKINNGNTQIFPITVAR